MWFNLTKPLITRPINKEVCILRIYYHILIYTTHMANIKTQYGHVLFVLNKYSLGEQNTSFSRSHLKGCLLVKKNIHTCSSVVCPEYVVFVFICVRSCRCQCYIPVIIIGSAFDVLLNNKKVVLKSQWGGIADHNATHLVTKTNEVNDNQMLLR